MWNEPFGMTLADAMAFGCPVVSTRAGGIPEIVVDGETGLLAEPGDPTSLARAIVELARDPAMRREMGRQGRARRAAHFTWELSAASLDRVLAGPGP